MEKILLLPGDGIGPEIVDQVKLILEKIQKLGLKFEIITMPIGGAGYDEHRNPLPDVTLEEAKKAKAIILGAVGSPQYDSLPKDMRPEQGLLQIRKHLELFANLRPAFVYDQLINSSTIRPEVIGGLDIIIVRELTGDIYFGKPRGRRVTKSGEAEAFDTMSYRESEIRRISKIAFEMARKRSKRVCSVDKANVLDTSMLWRELVSEIGRSYPDVDLSHMYVDNAGMQLVKDPKQFDVILTGNMFGDILSDQAAMLTGSIGMLPSASLNSSGIGLYEPVHGSAPDIAGKNKANPLAAILSMAMMFRYSFDRFDIAKAIENAVTGVLIKGYRTIDISEDDKKVIGTQEMGERIIDELSTV